MVSLSLFSVGKSILEKLGPFVQQEALLLWNLGGELEKLNGRVTSIQALLLDAEEHSHQVKDWLEKLEVLLFDAEDLLDDVATEALRKEATSRDRDDDDGFNWRIHCLTAVCFLLISIPSQLVYGLKMTHRVMSLMEQLDAIPDDSTKLQLNPRFEEKGKTRNHIHSISSIPDVFVGREDDLNHIRELLLLANDSNCSSYVSVVSVVGMGGMGKTTLALAQLIYDDGEVRKYFKLRLQTCVLEWFEVKVIIQKILPSATKKKKQDLELKPLANLLEERVYDEKYFLVLDDVWNFDPDEWDKLKPVLRSGASGSKILVTTRFAKFSIRMSCGSPNPPYALSGLSSPQSWSLFRQVVSMGDYGLDIEELQNIINLEELKTEIMNRSCGGTFSGQNNCKSIVF